MSQHLAWHAHDGQPPASPPGAGAGTMGTAPLWEHEVALAMTAIPLLRLADFAPTIRLVVPSDRTVKLPRLPDTPLPDALVTAHTRIVSA